MKTAKLFSLVLLTLTSLVSVSCSKNEETIDPALLNPVIEQGFKVDFKGRTFKTTETTARITGTTISISTQNLSGENFTISLAGTTIGEYSTDNRVSILYNENVSDVFGYISQNGIGTTATVNVLSIDLVAKRIKGTFRFIGNWNDPTNTTPPADIKFTNGTFDVPFTIQNPNFFEVEFNGQTFEATTLTATLSSGKIVLEATKGTSAEETFSFTLADNRLGDFVSVDDMFSYVAGSATNFGYVNHASLLSVNTGKVTITEIDAVNKTISGTFNYIGHWSDYAYLNPPAPIEFKNGSFKMPYTEEVATTDTFFAKVDGVEFVDATLTGALATVGTDNIISVTATNAADDIISIAIKDTFVVGTAYSAATEAKCSLEVAGTVSDASAGTVTILTKVNNRIAGTFTFTTVSGKIVTEGTFDVGY